MPIVPDQPLAQPAEPAGVSRAAAQSTSALVTGHFGEWLQGRMGPNGPLVLVTLPCPVLAVYRTAERGDPLPYSDAQLREFYRSLDVEPDHPPEHVSTIPPGCGAGASTAILVAIARAIGFEGSPEHLSKACLAVEGATDPLMYRVPDRLLWAAREARVVDYLTPPPRAEVVGGYFGAPQRTVAEDTDFPDVSDLILQWRRATQQGRLEALAEIATESAERCRRMRGPEDPMSDLVRETGALGYARAHTGSARALIFTPGRVPETTEAALDDAGLQGVFRFQTRS
ncbi:MAG: hypothetical protein AB3N13_09780 [Arenibacterium sp.]